nr:phosphatidylglycerophosphatase A [uncultured Prevotella sp.]
MGEKEIDKEKSRHLRPLKPVSTLPKIIGTGFGSGYFPLCPGTAGAVLALLIWILLGELIPLPAKESFPVALECFTIVLIIVFTIAGVWATAKLMPSWGNDPKRVVVDEMVGQWTALLAAPAFIYENRIWMALGALILFRFFDIFKPLGIRILDRKVGAFWVMADDLLAGIYSMIILIIVGNIPGWVI